MIAVYLLPSLLAALQRVTHHRQHHACTVVAVMTSQKQSQGQYYKPKTTTTITSSSILDSEVHAGTMRALALAILTKALELLSDTKPQILESILAASNNNSSNSSNPKHDPCLLTSRACLQALVQDTQGARRPPAVVKGTRLASIHETALVLKILVLLNNHSAVASRRLAQLQDYDNNTDDTEDVEDGVGGGTVSWLLPHRCSMPGMSARRHTGNWNRRPPWHIKN